MVRMMKQQDKMVGTMKTSSRIDPSLNNASSPEEFVR